MRLALWATHSLAYGKGRGYFGLKLPRDLSGEKLARLLRRFGYEITRQTGSHMRLTSTRKGREHHLTIPAHRQLSVGTLAQILTDAASYLQVTREQVAEESLRVVCRLPSGGGCYGIEAGEIDDNRLRTAANDDPGDGLGGGIQFLVRKVGGNENKVTGTHGFGRFAVAFPTDLPIAGEHVNDGFLLAVMVDGTSGMWLGDHYAGTDLGRAGKIAVDGGEAQNAGGLRCVVVETIVAGNTNAEHCLPPRLGCKTGDLVHPARVAVSGRSVGRVVVTSTQGSAKPIIFNVSCRRRRAKRLERGMPYQSLPVLGGMQCEDSFCA